MDVASLCSVLEGFRTLDACLGATLAIRQYTQKRFTLLERRTAIHHLDGVQTRIKLDSPAESVTGIEIASNPAGTWRVYEGAYLLEDGYVYLESDARGIYARVQTTGDGWGRIARIYERSPGAAATYESLGAGVVNIDVTTGSVQLLPGDTLSIGPSLGLVLGDATLEPSDDAVAVPILWGVDNTPVPTEIPSPAPAVSFWEPPGDMRSVAEILANRFVNRSTTTEEQTDREFSPLFGDLQPLLEGYRAWPDSAG